MVAKKMSPGERLKVFGRLNRIWGLHLTPVEFRLLSYLIDASIGYGRTTVDFTIDQIVNGSWTIRDDRDYIWLTPVNLSRTAVVVALNRLKSLGVLAWPKGGGRRKRTITINVEWKPTMPPHFNIPKRLQNLNPGAPEDEINVPSHGTLNANKCAVTRHHRQLVESQTVSKSSRKRSDESRVDDAEQVIRDVKSRPKKDNAKTRRAKLVQLWKDAWVEGHYDTLPPLLSERERGQLRQAVDRWPSEGEKVAQWAITNWRQVMREKFAWMAEPPPRPHTGFLLKFIVEFNHAFATFAGVQAYNFTDEDEYKRLLEVGLGPVAARDEVTRRRVYRETQTERDKERAELARERRALEQERREVLAERTKVRLTKEEREAILKNTREEPIRPARDHWSEETPNVDYGEWNDDSDAP